MAVAEDGRLELLVRLLEDVVVPVEAAAALGDLDEEWDEDAAVDRVVLVGAGVVRRGEDPCRGLALEVGDRVGDVEPLVQPIGARFDEAAHERAVLVERRLSGGAVLFEGERERAAAVELADERGERAEAKPLERVVEDWGAHRNELPTTRAGCLLRRLPFPR